jgi:hypothetical protein
MLHRQQRHELVMGEHYGSVLGLNHEPDIEETARELRMTRLGLRDQIGVPLPSQPPEVVGLGPRDVDGALARVGLVIEIEDLIGEALKPPFGDADQADRQIHAR